MVGETTKEDRVYLVPGNRRDFKTVADLGQFLFNFNDGRARNR